MDSAMIGGLVRAVVAALGGGMVASGVATDSELTAIAGAIAALVAGAWSIWVKYRAKR